MPENKYITVSALNRYIQYKFDQDIHLQNVYIKAEMSNIRLSKGIMYFVLKDEESEIDALMFQGAVTKLKFKPIDGMTVLVNGKVSVYQKRGRYSITVNTLIEAGLGDAYLNFLRLKEQLEKEGLFDPIHKVAIPKMSEAIGVITSYTGDAIRDIISTVEKRFPIAKILVYPALVQGSDAPRDMIRALKQANLDALVDVIIIGRGGGSVEDLSCFNDEQLARTIFDSLIPIVSAVGHENDFTICDFVADLRAPTPTGAAVLVTKDKVALLDDITRTQNQLHHLAKQVLLHLFQQYQSASQSYGLSRFASIIDKKEQAWLTMHDKLQLVSPLKLIENYNHRTKDLRLRLQLIRLDQKIEGLSKEINNQTTRLKTSIQGQIETMDQSVFKNIDKLILLNPLNVMKKGYTVAYQNNTIVSSIHKININQPLSVQFADGRVESKILEVKDEKLS